MAMEQQEQINTCTLNSSTVLQSYKMFFLMSNAKVYPGALNANEKVGHFGKLKLKYFPYCKLLNHAFTSEHVPSLKCRTC